MMAGPVDVEAVWSGSSPSGYVRLLRQTTHDRTVQPRESSRSVDREAAWRGTASRRRRACWIEEEDEARPQPVLGIAGPLGRRWPPRPYSRPSGGALRPQRGYRGHPRRAQSCVGVAGSRRVSERHARNGTRCHRRMYRSIVETCSVETCSRLPEQHAGRSAPGLYQGGRIPETTGQDAGGRRQSIRSAQRSAMTLPNAG